MAIADEIAAAEERAKAAAKRLRQLKSRQQDQEKRRVYALTKGDRLADTRRKILVGAMVLQDAERDTQIHENIQARLNTYLTRDDDRALFGLPAQQQPSQQPQ
jgi:large subunit ribosomal protein L7/L12